MRGVSINDQRIKACLNNKNNQTQGKELKEDFVQGDAQTKIYIQVYKIQNL